MNPQKQRLYQAYLLRCWAEAGPASAVTWRFSLEDPRTGRRRGFASLEALILALQSDLAAGDPRRIQDYVSQHPK